MTTSIEEMARQGGVREITLSGWDGENDITVKARRPSLYAMAAAGHIPNPLLPAADSLFMANGAAIQKSRFDDMAKMLDIIARETLVKPTFEELEQAGLTLTDTQYLEIYRFVIGGAASLERFREAVRAAAGRHGAADGV